MKASDIGERYKPILALFDDAGSLVVNEGDPLWKQELLNGQTGHQGARVLLNGSHAGYWKEVGEAKRIPKLAGVFHVVQHTYHLSDKGRAMIAALKAEATGK